MDGSVLVVWSEELLSYDLGATHPMAPGRLEFTMALARDLDVFAGRHVQIAAPRPASDEALQLIHDPGYIAAVRDAPRRGAAHAHDAFGLGGEDNPVFADMHEASALVTGATLDAARAVRCGSARHAVSRRLDDRSVVGRDVPEADPPHPRRGRRGRVLQLQLT